MVEQIIDQVITVSAGLAILGGGYFVWLLSGIANVIFTAEKKWSWKRMFEDLCKTLIMCISILTWVIVFNALDWFSKKMGADISNILEGASVTGLVGGIIGGTVYFVVKAYRNFYEFVNTSHVEAVVTDGQYDLVSAAVKGLLGAYIQQDEQTGETIDATESRPQLGSFPYYCVDVSTPEKFYNAVLGKGFDEGYGYQCVAGFKEYTYSLCGKVVATSNGKASGYATQQSQIESLGFKWHSGTAGLKDGDWAIFGTGSWGHVAMYWKGQWFGQNQNASDRYAGSTFNVANISLSGVIGYYRPNIYESRTPAEPVKPSKSDEVTYTYQQGDTFGMVIRKLGLGTNHGLWGEDGDVAYYTKQLEEQGALASYGIPVGTTITLKRRK